MEVGTRQSPSPARRLLALVTLLDRAGRLALPPVAWCCAERGTAPEIRRISPGAASSPSAPPGCLRWGGIAPLLFGPSFELALEQPFTIEHQALSARAKHGSVHAAGSALGMRGGPRCAAERTDAGPATSKKDASPATARTSQGWMPVWSGSLAGHCSSDSREERSVRCWSSTTLAKKHQATGGKRSTTLATRHQAPGGKSNTALAQSTGRPARHGQPNRLGAQSETNRRAVRGVQCSTDFQRTR
jgi:hypothetical protein